MLNWLKSYLKAEEMKTNGELLDPRDAGLLDFCQFCERTCLEIRDFCFWTIIFFQHFLERLPFYAMARSYVKA